MYLKINLSRILTIILVSFNVNEFELQEMTDRANSTFNEEQLHLNTGEKVSAIRRSNGTEQTFENGRLQILVNL